MDKNILVSVCMITYGHESYIEEAINSVLMQECDFDYELIIADDNSPDTTSKIVNTIIDNHLKAKKIKYYKHPANIGMQKNSLFAFSKCVGKYIAICEGDDYWTDPKKLQKQVDFLERNKEYAMVCSNYYLLEGNDLKKNDFTSQNSKIEISLKDILYKNPIGTLTALFRANLLEKFSLPSNTMIGDMWIWMHIATQSKIRYFDEYTGAYRVLQNSASHRNDLEKRYKFLSNAYEIVNHFSKNVHLTKQERKNIYLHRMYPLFENLSIRKKIFPFIKLYIQYIINTRSFSIIPLKLFVFHLFKTKHKLV